jgi:hypothetical protein
MIRISKRQSVMLAAVVIVVGVGSMLLFNRGQAAYRKKAELLQAGYTKAQVLNVMGEPTAEFAARSMLLNRQNPETWVYGRKFTLTEAFYREPPYFWPILLRFGPEADDIVVEFDQNGLVESINVPCETDAFDE